MRDCRWAATAVWPARALTSPVQRGDRRLVSGRQRVGLRVCTGERAAPGGAPLELGGDSVGPSPRGRETCRYVTRRARADPDVPPLNRMLYW